MKQMTFKGQFQLGTTLILFIFCFLVAMIEYGYQKEHLFALMSTKAATYMSAASSVREYAKDVLRPTMYSFLPSDRFVLEAMSTSYISRQVMGNLNQSFPEFSYKRAAIDPRNPVNLADDFEKTIIQRFASNPAEASWSGVVSKDSQSYYSRLKPIRVEQECLQCHGEPADAPKELLAIYGDKASFHYRVGDIVAADAIYIHMTDYYLSIKERAWMVFIVAFATLFLLTGLFFLLFNRTVLSRFKALIISFSDITGSESMVVPPFPRPDSDEFEQVENHFWQVAENLKVVHTELKVSEEKYRRFFESSPDAIVLCSRKAVITDINPAGMQLFRFSGRADVSREEQSFYLLFWDGHDADSVFHRVEKQGLVRDLEVSMVDRNGNRMETLLTATGISWQRGEFEGLECVIRDVTAKKQLDKYLAQTEKLASIGQLAAGVAHEINNPLGVITCYTRLIEKNPQADEQIRSDVEIIQKHAESCRQVVASLLDFARVSEPVMAFTNLNQCIDEILEVLHLPIGKTSIEVRKDYDPDLPAITADANMMKQVLMNLIFNAVQAMPEGGIVSLATSYDPSGRTCSIQVTDTGCGIPDEHLGRIFEPFFTTKKPGAGTGLGLSVSYGIVQRHGGTIQVESELGKGTSFSVMLPVRQGKGLQEPVRKDKSR